MHNMDIGQSPRNMVPVRIMGQPVSTLTPAPDRSTADTDLATVINTFNHEIKTPLTLAKLYTQMALQYGATELEQLHYLLKKADEQISAIASIADDILRPASARMTPVSADSGQVDMSLVLEDAVAEATLLYPRHLFRVSKCSTAIVSAKRHQLVQVIGNYLNNAVKYAPDSRIIEILCKKNIHEVFVCVRDHGPGIDAAVSDKIFDRSYRDSHALFSGIEGAGLGLYVVKGIIESCHGKVGVASVPGEGSNFFFRLPLYI